MTRRRWWLHVVIGFAAFTAGYWFLTWVQTQH
jgi:hypothetical protein